jgi:O-succinylbenzoic acid--CoA ligase
MKRDGADLETGNLERLPCPLQSKAENNPDAPAIITPTGSLTYRKFHESANRFAVQFASLKNQYVGVALSPDAKVPLILFGLMRAGAVACMTNPRWPDAYIERCLARVGCATRIADAPQPAEGNDTHDWTYDEDRAVTVMFSSGTTGEPKAVCHSFGNHFHSALASNQSIPLAPGDVWLLSLPMYHVAGTGIVFRAVTAGAAVAIPGAAEPFEESIARYAVTHVSLVATQLHRLLENPAATEPLSKLKAILLGGSAIPPALIRRAIERRLPIITSYGMTETASQIVAARPRNPADAISGRPLTAGTVCVDETGEVCVRGKSVFLGYVVDGKIRDARDPQGWFHTADLGIWTNDGQLRITGRKDNMFISGGENIQPEEIERALLECEGVLDAVVAPQPHTEFGNVPVAFVRLIPETPLDETALREHLLTKLPRYKIPKRFFPWPLDMDNATVKIPRAQWAARAANIAHAEPRRTQS